MYIAGSGSVLHGPGHPGGRDQYWILQYQVRNFSGDSEILHEIVRDTTKVGSCYFRFPCSITNYFVYYLGIPATGCRGTDTVF